MSISCKIKITNNFNVVTELLSNATFSRRICSRRTLTSSCIISFTTALFRIAFARWANRKVLNVSFLQLHSSIIPCQNRKFQDRKWMQGLQFTFAMVKQHISLLVLRYHQEIPAIKMSAWNLGKEYASVFQNAKLQQEY